MVFRLHAVQLVFVGIFEVLFLFPQDLNTIFVIFEFDLHLADLLILGQQLLVVPLESDLVFLSLAFENAQLAIH
jgi:hypothetical protein